MNNAFKDIDMKNPFEDQNTVHATLIEEAGGGIQLFKFPKDFNVYSHATTEETELIYNEIVRKKEYLPPQIKINNKSCIFDVGANIGIFTLFIKSLCNNATMYIFEPINETFKVLQKNVKLHNLLNVKTHNVAIGDKDFHQKEYVYYRNLPSSSTSDPSTKESLINTMLQFLGKEQTDRIWEKSIQTATVRTLSSIIRENNIASIDLLKIDVEGDECAVLRGLEPEHYQLVKQLAIEVHSPELLSKVQVLLKEMGFICFEQEGISSGDTNTINLYAVRN